MEYFRRFLIFLRSEENLHHYKYKISTMALIASLVGFSIGFLLDAFLPFGYLSNMARGVVSILTGFTLFSFSYLFSIAQSRKRIEEDKLYATARERFSYRQRVNFSVVVGAVVASFILLSSQDSFFTFKTSLSIFIAFVLVAFCRKRRSEFIKNVYEIPDIRDLEAAKKRKKLLNINKKEPDKK